jgi:FAD synthase
VVTFDEHPQKVLTGEGPLRLLSLEHRLLLLTGPASLLRSSFLSTS